MTRDELEFSISQYLDGTLSLDERAALELCLADDADARALLDEYRELQGAIKLPAKLPAIEWDALALHISGTIDAIAPAVTAFASADSLDDLVVGFSDGSMPAEQRAAFDHRLAVDTDAAALLNEYRRLDSALASIKTTDPVPAFRWNALAEHLAGLVADAGAKPVFSFKWARTAGRIAVAACVLVATGIGLNTYRGNRTQPIVVVPQMQPQSQGFAVIVGPQPEAGNTSGVLDIQIGGPTVATARVTPAGTDAVASVEVDNGIASQFADVIMARPSRVVIANGDNTAQDSAQMPY